MAFVLTRRPDRTNRQADDRTMGIDVRDSARPILISDTGPAVQSKSLVITDLLGDNKVLQIDSIRWELFTDANPGTRQIALEILDGVDVIWKSMFDSGTDLETADNEATELYSGGNPFLVGATPAVGGAGPHKAPLPPNLFVGSGQTLRLFVKGGFSGDNLTVHIKGREV